MNMKKKLIGMTLLAAILSGCVKDDKYEMSNFKSDIDIVFNGTTATVTGDTNGFVSVNGADVTVNGANNTTANMTITLSGSTSEGSLLVYNLRSYTIVLNGVSINNSDGPAINNQGNKALYINIADGTTNTLTDGTTYAPAPVNAKGDTIDQKATLFSEGQFYLRGNGTLNINANAKNAIASDDYVVMESGNINISVSNTGSNGIKVNDGFTIKGGTLNIDVEANGARGIKNDARTAIEGGYLNITTLGDCKIETVNGVKDTTSCAGIKSDSLLLMSGGVVNIVSTGDGGKGINCSLDFEQQGGKLCVTTTGTKSLSKPHAIKADGNITFTGGEAYVASTRKAFNCDGFFLLNGGTVMGIGKKESVPSILSTQNFKCYDEDDEIDAIGGQTLTVDGISYTIPSVFTCRNAYILVSSSNLSE